MGCEEIRDLLPLYAGGEVTSEERAAAEGHVTLCASCARELDLYRESRAVFAVLRQDEFPQGAGKSLWEGIRKEIFPHKARVLLADELLRCAAALFVGLSLGLAIHVARGAPAEGRAIGVAAPAPRSGGEVLPAGDSPARFKSLRPSPAEPAFRFDPREDPRPSGGDDPPRLESFPHPGEQDF